jgi:hypothetical protein
VQGVAAIEDEEMGMGAACCHLLELFL